MSFLSFRLALLLVLLGGASFAQAQSVALGLVRHAPNVNGTVEGSLQQDLGEYVNLNSGAVITGQLLVPGTPGVRFNGTPVFGGTSAGAGSAQPSNYYVTINQGGDSGRAAHPHRRERVDDGGGGCRAERESVCHDRLVQPERGRFQFAA